jgi:hypothetical protein
MIRDILPNIEKIMRINSYPAACALIEEIIYQNANRTKILVLSDPTQLHKNPNHYQNYDLLPAGNMEILCNTMATAEERIAALVVNSNQSTGFYYKKVRELASAENALMIWDTFDQSIRNVKIPVNAAPDIVCFQLPMLTCGVAFTRTLASLRKAGSDEKRQKFEVILRMTVESE